MPRPRKDRMVMRPPLWTAFKVAGKRSREGIPVAMSLDEFEAIRLADYEGLEHAEAAAVMAISRPTFTRLIESARKKTALLFIEGKEIRIEGGSVHFKGNIYRCLDCGKLTDADFEKEIENCPECGSERLTNIAESFGHGRCCKGHSTRRF
jgi:uncharacterized protein